MFRKKKFTFGKMFYTALVLILLSSFIISSCKGEEVPEVDPNTLPLANFFYEIQYRTLDGNTHAFVTAHDKSAYSNRWQWNRPGSRTEISGPVEFTTDQDTAVTQVYLATDQEQHFEITLVTYSYVPIGINPDSTIIYEIFESLHPCIREVVVKKPEE